MEHIIRGIIADLLDPSAVYEELESAISESIDYESIAQSILADFDLEELIAEAAAEAIRDDFRP